MFAKRILRNANANAVTQPQAQIQSAERQWLLSNDQVSPNPTDSESSSSDNGEGNDAWSDADSEIEESKKDFWKKLNDDRLKKVYWLDGSMVQKYWDLLDLILNLVFCGSYICLTWYSIGERGANKDTPAPPPPPHYMEVIDFALAFSLLGQWLPHIYYTLFPITELQTSWSLATLISTLSVFWVYFDLSKTKGTFLEGGSIVFLYPFRFWRLHGTISRCFPTGRKGFFLISPVKQKAINLALSIFTTLFLVTAWTHIVLYKVQKYYDLNFLDIFYTIAVSSTSGLSTNIVPDNTFSRIVTFGIMIIGAIFLPTQISDLITLVRSQSSYRFSFKPLRGRSHVIVVGNLEIVSLRGFLREFYSADHGSRTLITSVVMLSPNEPSPELQDLLADPIYSHRVQYIKGSCMSFRALQKAKVGSAKAAFVLASRLSEVGPVEEDAKTVMRCVSLRKFHRKLKIYAQILMPRNKIHLEGLADEILCIDEFRLGMAAQSCIAPGFSTILYILTNSISEKAIGGLSKLGSSSWIREYLHGATTEIYEVVLDQKYEGMKFADAAISIYRHHGALLFAIGRDCASGEEGTFDSEQVISFVPFQTHLKGGERAYLITGSSRAANRVGRYDFPSHDSSNPSFWNEFEIDNHIQRTTKREVSRVSVASSSMSKGDLLHNSSTSLESMTATIRSLSQRGKSDFTVLKQKSSKKEGEEEEVAPALSTPTVSNPRPVMQEFELGSSLPATVENHYLYCILGFTFPSNLAYFVSPIRQKDKQSPIVFLCQSPPAEEDWQILEEFGNVFYIVGSPLLRRDLRKAKVTRAIRTVCFADPTQFNVVDRAADSSILLTLLNIQATSKNSTSNNFVTVEFIHVQNMKLIGSYDHRIKEDAATEVLELDMQNVIPAFCGGHVFSSGMFHSVLCQAYYEHNLIPVLKMFLFDGGCSDGDTSSSFFFQLELPLDGRFKDLPFGSLFTLMIKRYQVLLLGLYRQTLNDTNGKKFQYVYLNPKPDSLIQETDLCFAIGVKKPVFE